MDDQRTNRECGDSVSPWRVYVAAIAVSACVLAIIGLLSGLSPQAVKGTIVPPPVTLKDVAIATAGGALMGIVLGIFGGVLMVLFRLIIRLVKTYFPTT